MFVAMMGLYTKATVGILHSRRMNPDVAVINPTELIERPNVVGCDCVVLLCITALEVGNYRNSGQRESFTILGDSFDKFVVVMVFATECVPSTLFDYQHHPAKGIVSFEPWFETIASNIDNVMHFHHT